MNDAFLDAHDGGFVNVDSEVHLHGACAADIEPSQNNDIGRLSIHNYHNVATRSTEARLNVLAVDRDGLGDEEAAKVTLVDAIDLAVCIGLGQRVGEGGAGLRARAWIAIASEARNPGPRVLRMCGASGERQGKRHRECGKGQHNSHDRSPIADLLAKFQLEQHSRDQLGPHAGAGWRDNQAQRPP
ncbi:MAG: hypothetical protein JO163_16515 [Methylobacteriaceae bacterium]|nr:hypothetical protein [Methylobacteriaceae bacterium]MBV9704336.1 hypothetical protein [Methylobacteriaceae bacterium]